MLIKKSLIILIVLTMVNLKAADGSSSFDAGRAVNVKSAAADSEIQLKEKTTLDLYDYQKALEKITRSDIPQIAPFLLSVLRL